MKYPDSGGGLNLIWENDVKLEIINFTTNHILAKVKEDDGFEWYLNVFMVGLKQVKRRSLGSF